jgi:phenylpyruvate tautomerase PptA (4-oxalocrotonate tautomerase family)
MPTYVCTVMEGRLSTDQKSRIAAEITRIHSEVTGTPTVLCSGNLRGGQAR